MRRSAFLLASIAITGALAFAPGSQARAGKAEIVRDEFGVPHIFVDPGSRDRLASAAYADGYAQAEDRLFQMDVFRRTAQGRLAELPALGEPYLDMDVEFRRDASTKAQLRRDYFSLPARWRRALAAFARGVNRFIAEVTADPTRMPIEYVFQAPERWDVTDTLSVFELQVGVYASGGGEELGNAKLLLDLRNRFPESEARGIVDDLVWIDDPSSPTTISPDEQHFPDFDRIERYAPAQMETLDTYSGALAGASGRCGAPEIDIEPPGGAFAWLKSAGHESNAIVLAGSRTQSGKPILLGGPQTGLTIPNFSWEVGFHGEGMEAHGLAMPGAPGVYMGKTPKFAFTVTSSAADDTDVYLEILDPNNPDRYLYRGQSVPFRHRREVFEVAGGEPVEHEYLYTVHGPVMFKDEQAGIALTCQRALARRTSQAGVDLLGLALATSPGTFFRQARSVEAGFNIHYADVYGNVAYFHQGLRPRRPGHADPRLPLLGTGEQEWRGVIRQRPRVVNPAAGMIVNWNNKPAAGWPAGDRREHWGPVHRVQGLTDGLGDGDAFTPEGVSEVMRKAAMGDVFASRIVPHLSEAVEQVPPEDPDRPRLVESRDLIEAWVEADASLAAEGETIPHPGAALYREWRTQVQGRVFADELGSFVRGMDYPELQVGYQEDDHGSFDTPDALFLRALQGDEAELPLSRNYFDDVNTGEEETRDEVLVDALRTTLANLEARFGTPDMSAWLQPKLETRYSDLGAAFIFYGYTVTERMNRGSFNLLVELQPEGGQIILPPGESGAITLRDLLKGIEPPHLRDQLPLYEDFQYRPIRESAAAIPGSAAARAPAPPPTVPQASTSR